MPGQPRTRSPHPDPGTPPKHPPRRVTRTPAWAQSLAGYGGEGGEYSQLKTGQGDVPKTKQQRETFPSLKPQAGPSGECLQATGPMYPAAFPSHRRAGSSPEPSWLSRGTAQETSRGTFPSLPRGGRSQVKQPGERSFHAPQARASAARLENETLPSEQRGEKRNPPLRTKRGVLRGR